MKFEEKKLKNRCQIFKSIIISDKGKSIILEELKKIHETKQRCHNSLENLNLFLQSHNELEIHGNSFMA